MCGIGVLVAVGAVVSPAEAGTVGRWHFDEAPGASVAADSFGSLDGSLEGSAEFVIGGVSGNAVFMTAAGGGLVTMGDVLPMTSGDFSIAVWVRTTVSGESFLIGKHLSGSAPGYFIGLNTSGALGFPNKAYFYNSNGGDPNDPYSTTTVNNDAWHQIVAVFHAGGNAEIFVEDGPAEDTESSHTIAKAAASFLVGGLTVGGSPTSYYTGMVDELRVFGHALDQAEVEHLYFNPEDAIFSDGFESGDLTEWSSSVGSK